MEYCFTQSVSGWRAVFGGTADKNGAPPVIATASDQRGGKQPSMPFLPQAALAVSSFVELLAIPSPVVMVGMDTRPTSGVIAAVAVQSLLSCGAIVRFAGVVAAPEIMAASHSLDGFVFVTASHNPVEYNGLKFGRAGAVLCAADNAKLSSMYRAKCDAPSALFDAKKCFTNYHREDADLVYRGAEAAKRKALEVYQAAVEKIIGDVSFAEEGFAVLADFNGGARAMSIDKDFFVKHGIGFYAMNSGVVPPGVNRWGSFADKRSFMSFYGVVPPPSALSPVHGIVPEGENLLPLAQEMERLHASKTNDKSAPYGVVTSPPPPVLGYMTDCDGDRGNIVYWDDASGKAQILDAQEVFALAALHYLSHDKSDKKAVAVNCATSGRIDEVAASSKAKVCRSEVGEANVEAAAEAARQAGYSVPIAGEGSNGGLITYPSKVRDPIMTVFALLSLLREYGSVAAAIKSIPPYTTTGTAEDRAQLHLAANKSKLQEVFAREWQAKKDSLAAKYGFASYDVALTNGSQERILQSNGTDSWDNGKGGLKVRFFDAEGAQTAFLWMRQSGTENLLRVVCDVRGGDKAEEAALLDWWKAMIGEAAK